MSDNFITNAINYYDTALDKYREILDNKYKISYDIPNKIYFRNTKDDVVLSGEFEILSTYDRNTNIWKWHWSTSSTMSAEPIMIYTVKKILNYGIDIETNNNIYINVVKKYLTTSKFKLTGVDEEYILCAIISYITKIPLIIYDPNDYMYILIHNDTIKLNKDHI